MLTIRGKLMLLLMMAALVALPLSAQDEADGASADPAANMDPAAMEAFVTAMSPAEPHEYLARYVGDWSYEQNMWSDPTQQPLKASGESTKTMILGGRFLQEEMKGEMMGQPFYGRSLTGFDNVTQRYRGTWVDNFSTGIVVSEGEAAGDAGGHTLNAEYVNPMSGVQEKIRMVTRHVDDDHHIFEYYVTDPSGKEFRQMVIEYTRQ